MYMVAHLSMIDLTCVLNARPWLHADGSAALLLGHCFLSFAAATQFLHCCLQKD